MKLFANITNEALAKLTSLEFLGGAVVSVFLVGMLWANMNGSIAEAQEEALSNKETLTDVQKELSSIKMDVAVIRQSQLDYIRTQDQGDRQTAEELRDIKGMLMDLASDRSKHD